MVFANGQDKQINMIKAFGILIVGFIALVSLPIFLGLAGGLFGLIFGVVGGVIGLFCAVIGGVIGFIAGIFRGITHLLFGWHSDFGFHPWHWHLNGYTFAAILVLILIVVSQKKK